LTLIIHGLHGLGDNLRMRSIVKQLMLFHDVWLETPWPCLFHDMDIKFLAKSSKLRTQAKNAKRESVKFTKEQAPSKSRQIAVNYPPASVRQHGNVLAAMSAQAGVSIENFDLPIPDEWDLRAKELIDSWNVTKPILIYRPLIERTEWSGCSARNPDKSSYSELFESIRDKFFIVSVADLVDDVEWMVSDPINADVTYHKGELDIEILAALVNRSAAVYSSPGFAAVLAQSVGTPSVVIFGGYENSQTFSHNGYPYLGIDTIKPCDCFSHHHSCVKEINIPVAKDRLMEFVNEYC